MQKVAFILIFMLFLSFSFPYTLDYENTEICEISIQIADEIYYL